MAYLAPTTLDAALQALGEDSWLVVAGGTDVLPAHVGRSLPERVLDISGIDELRGVEVGSDIVQIGAAVPKEERAFGLAVPKEWADAHLGEAQIFEAVTEAFSANVLSQEQKKTSGDASSSATSPLPPTAADAGPAERPMQEDVSVAGTLIKQI